MDICEQVLGHFIDTSNQVINVHKQPARELTPRSSKCHRPNLTLHLYNADKAPIFQTQANIGQ